jgi:uncharacterized membrane protein
MTDASRGFGRHLRQRLLTGVVVLLPLFITLWLLSALFQLVDGTITPWVREGLSLTGIAFFQRPAFFRFVAPLAGLVTTVLLVYAAGWLSTNLFGVRLLRAFDRMMLRIPVVRAVYGGSKQLMEALNPQSSRAFTEVVLVEYPRAGVFTIGFVTRDGLPLGPGGAREPLSTVFLPTTPNPTSGWIAILPRSAITPLPLTVEEGIKMVVSGGIVVPPRWEAGSPPPGPDPR